MAIDFGGGFSHNLKWVRPNQTSDIGLLATLLDPYLKKMVLFDYETRTRLSSEIVSKILFLNNQIIKIIIFF